MSTPLLATKLYIPAPRETTVHRQRLFDRLERGLSRKLILLSAPAGFGKTTLLSAWLEHGKHAAAWLTVDDGDNDSSRFLSYILGALRTILPGIGNSLLDAIQSPPSPQAEFSEATLVAIINEITAANPGDFLLVLDDYHLLTAGPAQQITGFLLENLPPMAHLVIGTRADPDLPLPRLRGRDEMVEIRQHDLRFKAAETAVFLKQTLDSPIAAADVAALTSRTEGWAAGLQLAALSMSGSSNVSGFIQDFTGSDRYILDYLMEEVFAQQPEEMQNFLLQTSILDRLCSGLCTAVTGVQASQQLLERCEKENLFTITLDNERHWYRYHQLFADLLQKRLGQVYPNLVQELHDRASHWHESNGNIPAAIHHALTGSDHRSAVRLVEQIAEETAKHGQLDTLIGWVSKIPEEFIQSGQEALLFYLWALLTRNAPAEEINRYLKDFQARDETIAGIAMVLQSVLAVHNRQLETAFELAQQALQRLPPHESFFRNTISWYLTIFTMFTGDFSGAGQALDDLATDAFQNGNVYLGVGAFCSHARLQKLRGRLDAAEKYYRRALARARGDRGNYLPVAGQALIGLGQIALEKNELRQAEENLRQGISLTGSWKVDWTVEAYLALLRVKQAQADAAGYAAFHAELLELEEKQEPYAAEAQDFSAQRANLELIRGNLEPVALWLAERSLSFAAILPELKTLAGGETFQPQQFRWSEFLTFAHWLFATNALAEALTVLDHMLAYITRPSFPELGERIIYVEVLRALVLQDLDRMQEALTAIGRALSLAQASGYVRVFLDGGEKMRTLLAAAQSKRDSSDFAAAILLKFPAIRDDSAPPGELLLDPLSERELEVLRLLPTKLTAPEIAARLFIAESTVRTHIKHIYSKLNVNRRFEAIERGEEIGLL